MSSRYWFKRLAHDWDKLATRNPFGAILTGEDGAIEEWEPETFFATGMEDARAFMSELSAVGVNTRRHLALDFGCGVGRVTRALTQFFDRVIGVDVARHMVDTAKRLNRNVRGCEFVLNTHPNLSVLPSGMFDVVYCRLVLQHVPPDLVPIYIAELLRVLSPDGVLMFQLPEAVPPPLSRFMHAPISGTPWKRMLPTSFVRGYRLVKYGFFMMTSGPRMRMFGLNATEVEAVIRRSEGQLLAKMPDTSHSIPDVAGFRYWVKRSGGAAA